MSNSLFVREGRLWKYSDSDPSYLILVLSNSEKALSSHIFLTTAPFLFPILMPTKEFLIKKSFYLHFDFSNFGIFFDQHLRSLFRRFSKLHPLSTL